MEKRCYGCMKLKQDQPICEHCGYYEGSDRQSHHLPLGTLLNGQYEVGRVLGQGGFGITYLGWDRLLEAAVAIKEYYPQSIVSRRCDLSLVPDQREPDAYRKGLHRFLQEAQILAKLRGTAGIVSVYTFFQENGTAYFVMEYLDGPSLEEYVAGKGGTLTFPETMTLLSPILEALTTVHQADLIHRDVSPDNIKLKSNGEIKLLDFGIARSYTSNLTVGMDHVLKRGYSPIEQYHGKNIGPWTDIYALCATIHYCLTGKVPPDALERFIENTPLKLQALPAGPAAVLERGLAMDHRDRFSSVGELQQALGQKKPPFPARLLILGALVLVLAGAGLWLTFSRKAPPNPEPPPSLQETTSPATEPWTPPQNLLAPDPVPDGADAAAYPVFSSRYTRRDITSVRFLDTLSSAPEGSWDVSADRSGEVQAWVNSGCLFLAAEGKINGRMACAGLFHGYEALETVDFGGCFLTEEATDVSRMFAGCTSLTGLDLGELSLSQIRDQDAYYQFLDESILYQGRPWEAVFTASLYSPSELAAMEPGQLVQLGYWEQDGRTDNGPEPIQWKVLHREDDRVLLISGAALDVKPYHDTYENTTWETCSLRQWLNEDFYRSAFTQEERSLIAQTLVPAQPNPRHATGTGLDTQDKLFLLSIEEALRYFPDDQSRSCIGTAWTAQQGAYVSTYDGGCWWWLRTPGGTSRNAANVNTNGTIDFEKGSVNSRLGTVRPALWLQAQ